MKYRVYYSDNGFTIEADNSKEAAKMYFLLNRRDSDCNISVEEQGIGNEGLTKYHISEFNSKFSKPPQNPEVPPQVPPNVEKRFPSRIFKYLTIIGWLNIIIAATLFVLGVISIDTIGLALIGTAFASLISGIIILVLGELIQVLLGNKTKTRMINVLLDKIVNKGE